VLLLESIAQCGAVAVLSDPKYAGRLPLFGGVEHARFRRQVVPGDTVTLECEMTKLSARAGKGHGTASVNGQLAAETDLLFILADAP
jgi:3-hydroxyacyl-[acyl-carrier-protein] dehydratase